MAVLIERPAFRSFIIFNSLAMSTALISTFYFVQGIHFIDRKVVNYKITHAKFWLVVSLFGLMLAFGTGTYVIIPFESNLFAGLVLAFIMIPSCYQLKIMVKVATENYLNTNWRIWSNWSTRPSHRNLVRTMRWSGLKTKLSFKFFI